MVAAGEEELESVAVSGGRVTEERVVVGAMLEDGVDEGVFELAELESDVVAGGGSLVGAEEGAAEVGGGGGWEDGAGAALESCRTAREGPLAFAVVARRLRTPNARTMAREWTCCMMMDGRRMSRDGIRNYD